MCVRWLLGLSWISALYDTPAERSIAFLFVATLAMANISNISRSDGIRDDV